MKRNIIFPCLALLLTATLGGCIQPLPEDEGIFTEPPIVQSESAETDAKPAYIYQTMNYTYKTDITASLDAIVTQLDPDYLLLINQFYTLDEDFVPQSLTSLTCPTYNGKTVELESRAATALYAMLAEMEEDGITDIAVTSGYRSYNRQQQLQRDYLNKEKSTITPDAYAYFGAEYIQSQYLDRGLDRLTEEDALKVVLSYSALPGASEHQSGLCVDFVTSTAMLTESFENTEAFDWLSLNAYRFGFILRYPANKTQITGYTYEPWHFRFVGREAATEIRFHDLTLEEFLTNGS